MKMNYGKFNCMGASTQVCLEIIEVQTICISIILRVLATTIYTWLRMAAFNVLVG